MKYRWLKSLVVMILTLQLIPALATDKHAPLTPEELFSDDKITSFTLSPDGKYIAYVSPIENTDILTIAEVDTMKQTFSVQMGKKKYVGDMIWANNTRLLLRAAKKYGLHEKIYYTPQLQAFNFDGSQNVKLYGYRTTITNVRSKSSKADYFYIENILENDPENIQIVTYEGGYSTRVLRKLNIYNSRMTNGERSQVRRASYVTTNTGEAVAQWGISEDNDSVIIYKDKDNKWIPLDNANNYESAWAYKEDSLLLKYNAGENIYQYFQLNRLTGEKTLLTESQDIEIYLEQDEKDKIIGYSSYVGKRNTVYFDENDPRIKFYRLVEKTFKNYDVTISLARNNPNKGIISIDSDVEPGKYYLYDAKAKAKLRLLNTSRKSIDRKRFSKMEAISFKARDGMNIHGYLTRPNGSTGKDPMVVVVHGGPFGVRDWWGYDSEVQLLASQGYAVLQINFRGSSGYGQEFKESGYKQWGLTMQDDITDGTLWAVKQGYADKSRMCIYGGSYGGYAALQATVKTPDLFKCAIGFVGVYDLPLMYEVGDIQDRKEGEAFMEKTIGKDMEQLAANSPARHTDKIKAALFLVHGGGDERVPVEHHEALTKALDKRGYPYESLVKEDEEHGFVKNENQYELYGKMLKFLQKHI